jgi:hypothetical protein
MQLRKKMRIDIGKYNFNIDGDENLSSLVLALKKDYESLETQVKNFTLQKDENFACTVGEQEMEYPMDSKGFARFKKDMDKFYADKAKCDAEKAKCDAELAMEDAKKNWFEQFKTKKDAVDAEIEVLKAELTNRDSIDTQTIIAEKAKELSVLVNKATTMLNVDSDSLFSKSAIEIKKEVITKTYPTLNLDGKTDVAIDAMFETCELYKNDSKRIIEEQKQLINNTVTVNNFDSQDSIPELTARMKSITTAWEAK